MLKFLQKETKVKTYNISQIHCLLILCVLHTVSALCCTEQNIQSIAIEINHKWQLT